MIATGGVRPNGELRASRLDGEDGAFEKRDPRRDLRQDAEMGFQAPTEYPRLELASATRDDGLEDEERAISFDPVFFTAVLTE
jgi:hypothetical protein